jgi:hypothetical protein
MPNMLAGHGRAIGEELDGVGGRELRVRQDRTSGLHHRLPIQVSLISSFVSTFYSSYILSVFLRVKTSVSLSVGDPFPDPDPAGCVINWHPGSGSGPDPNP